MSISWNLTNFLPSTFLQGSKTSRFDNGADKSASANTSRLNNDLMTSSASKLRKVLKTYIEPFYKLTKHRHMVGSFFSPLPKSKSWACNGYENSYQELLYTDFYLALLHFSRAAFYYFSTFVCFNISHYFLAF